MSYLLIYADEDYILPIIKNEESKLCEFATAGGDDSRLWLYFQTSSNGVSYGKDNKYPALSRDSGYYAHLWQALVDNQRVEISNTSRPFFDLLRNSSFLKDLKDFWQRSTAESAENIPTVYLFADSEVIPKEARSRFIQEMEQEEFSTVSFSVNPFVPICNYVGQEWGDIRPEFGDSILLLNSVGDSLRFSSVTYDGKDFLTDGKNERVENFGDSPIKMALVRYVVDKSNKAGGGVGILNADKLEFECRYQYRNADRWFALAKDRNGHFRDFDVEDFRFSFETPDLPPHAVYVPQNVLDSQRNDMVNTAIQRINRYAENVLGKKASFVVFCGAAFEDADFTDKILRKLDIHQKMILTTRQLSKALFCYFSLFPDWKEDIRNAKQIFEQKERECKSVSRWIEHAVKISTIKRKLMEAMENLNHALEHDQSLCDEMFKKCANSLKASSFDEALKALALYELPSDRFFSSISTAKIARQESLDMSVIYESVESIGNAGAIVNEIHQLEEDIMRISNEPEEWKTLLSNRRKQVDFYREHYQEYLSLKSGFSRETDYHKKKDILNRLKEISEEELPVLTGELPHVSAFLSGRVETRRRFFGKSYTLKYKVQIEAGKSLPCDVELHLATRALIMVTDRMCVSIPIPKGTSGTVEGEVSIPDSNKYIEPGKTINMYLFVHQDVLDRGVVDAKMVCVKY